MKTIELLAAAASLMVLTGAAKAALIDRGGGMIYDSTRNITWLADMNHAATSGYAAANAGGSGSNTIWSDGRMGWDAANAWANNLVYGGFDDWRLPTLNPSDTTCSSSFDPGGGYPLQYSGTGCTGGELSGLFVAELGNKAGESVLDPSGDTPEQIANRALFKNVQGDDFWSGTEYAPSLGFVWYFKATQGRVNLFGKTDGFHALAVRPGDVATAVPEPQTLALALLALGATGLVRRRTKG